MEIINKNIGLIKLSTNSVNAIDSLMLDKLYKVIHSKEFLDVSVLIVTGNDKHFSAGANLKDRSTFTNTQTLEFLDKFNKLLHDIEKLDVITISSIRGACLGGGLELALSTDFRIASDTSILGFPEVSIGIIPGAGGTQRLTRLTGTQTSMKWIFSSEKYTSKDALADGIIDFSVSDNNLDSFTQKFASNISNNAPLSLKASKSAIKSAYIDHGFIKERQEYLKTLNSNDRNEGLASFKEKRPPKWNNK